jgi:hypothetical protein
LLMFSRLIIADVCLGYLLLFRANFADKQYNTPCATRPTRGSGTAGEQKESKRGSEEIFSSMHNGMKPSDSWTTLFCFQRKFSS